MVFLFDLRTQESYVWDLIVVVMSLGRESALVSAVPHFIINLLEVICDIIKLVKKVTSLNLYLDTERRLKLGRKYYLQAIT